MKRFNFGSFLVDESNQRAFQLCHDIADLKPVTPMPVVLLGDEGCGKTHLLYSIVNRVRAGSSKTGLAYVTAYDFPDQVRALIDDPSPVERARSAILLVDQFERFRDLVEELEAVIRIFLDNNHYVVIATSVHPGRLQHLSESFHDILDKGQVAQIVPRGSETQIDKIKRQLREESETQLLKKQEEIEELRALLSRVGKDVDPDTSATIAGLREELDTERVAKAELTKRHEVAKGLAESVQEELASTRSELDRMRALVQQAGQDARASVQVELDQARDRAERAEAEAASRAEEIARFKLELAERDRLLEPIASLREALDQAKTEAAENLETARQLHGKLDAAQEEASTHFGTAESLRTRLDSVEKQLSVETESQTALRNELEEARALMAQQAGELTSLRAHIDGLTSQLGSRSSSEEELRAELEQARAVALSEQEKARDLLERFERAESEAGSHAATSSGLRSRLEQVESERDALGKRLADLETQWIEAEGKQRASDGELERLHGELASLQSAKSDAGRLAAEAQGLRTEVEQLREARAAANIEIASLKTDVEVAGQERDEARKERGQVVERAERLLGQIESIRSEYAAVSRDQRNRIAELESAIETQAANSVDPEEVAQLRARAAQARTEVEAVREASVSEINQLRQEADELRESLRSALDEKDASETARSEAVQQIEDLRAALDRTKNAHDALAFALEETKEERDRLHDRASTLEEDRAQFDIVRQELIREREGVQAQLEAADRELSARTAELDALRRDLAEQLAAREADLDALRRDAADQVAALKAELEASRQDAAEQVAAAKAHAGELESELKRLRQTSDAMRKVSSNAGLQLEGAAKSLAQIATGLVSVLSGSGAPHDLVSPDDGGGKSSEAVLAAQDTVSSAREKLRPLKELDPYEEGEDHSI